jgi:hypothetical protein
MGRPTPVLRYTPRLLREVGEVFGDARALKLAMAFGGQRVRIPVRPHPGHQVARELGLDVLRWLSARHGGEYLQIPTGARSLVAEQADLVRRLVEAGLSANEIVRQARVSSRTVHRVRERLRAERQPDLFSRAG